MFEAYFTPTLRNHIAAHSDPVPGCPQLVLLRSSAGSNATGKEESAAAAARAAKARFESPEALTFVANLYEQVRQRLAEVLRTRIEDRRLIDSHTRECVAYNTANQIEYTASNYRTSIGLRDQRNPDRVVFGPRGAHSTNGDRDRRTSPAYASGAGHPAIAPIPAHLQGPHVTLFGPPDTAKMAINAMNCAHRTLPKEPPIVKQLALAALAKCSPKWGADDEDSKTPIREDLVDAGVNLMECFNGTLEEVEPPGRSGSGRRYALEATHRALPIKRIPGLGMPCMFLMYRGPSWTTAKEGGDGSTTPPLEPIPLHIWDFALHMFHNWSRPEALTFYVPKLENEEEAEYLKLLIATAEQMIVNGTRNEVAAASTTGGVYQLGTVRLMIVLESARAVFRANEIITALHPYFVGASLGWHDYLASAARLFKEDPNYRIPVKADPNIVINYIKASHLLLSDVVGPRGGIKVGGMYGVLPVGTDMNSASFQVTMRGYFLDVFIQLKRGLTGFWVAHPDFVRLGLAMVEAWRICAEEHNDKPLRDLVGSVLLDPKSQAEVLSRALGADDDVRGLDASDPSRFARALVVADVKESAFIANHDPDEIRYNVFQTLQYLADWLSGNGCVALPAQIQGVAVRVMDDLATCERSRWEVWHMIRHGFFGREAFLRIVEEEMDFIRHDRSNDKKIVQVKYHPDRTAKWYAVAKRVTVKLMTDPEPVEFVPELLLPFTLPVVRRSTHPWDEVLKIAPEKYASWGGGTAKL